MAAVKLKLAKEQVTDAQRGNQIVHEISASLFLVQGLDLEEQQYVIIILRICFC